MNPDGCDLEFLRSSLRPFHEVYAEAMKDFCHWHNRFEPVAPGDFRVCFECGHVWRTRAALEADMEWGCWEAYAPFQADLLFCPLCLHDW